MPKSKRDKVLSLTKVDKKATKSAKGALIEKIHENADSATYAWVFGIDHMRNNCIKEVREQWKGSKIFLGKKAVMRVGLGATVETEHRPGLHRLSDLLEGDTGLLFTSEEPSVVVEWFASYRAPDFARTGNLATHEVTLPAGPVILSGDERAPSSIQPELAKLGLPSKLVKGVPTLDAPYTVCKKDAKLQPNQVNLLKHLGVMMATFQVKPQACVNMETGVLLQAADVETSA